MGVQADEAQRNRGLNVGIREARKRSGEFHVVAEFAAHDDVAGTHVLALARGQAVVAFQVVAQAPIVIHPHAVSGGWSAQRGGERAVAVPVLVVDGGERERERELRGEGGRQPFDGEARGEDGDRGGHRQQVAGGPGEEDGQGAGEEDADPGEQEARVGFAAPAPGEGRGGGHQGGEDDPPGVDEEHQRVLEFVLDGLERVGGEVLGELACRHRPGGEAGEKLPGDEDEQGREQVGTGLAGLSRSRPIGQRALSHKNRIGIRNTAWYAIIAAAAMASAASSMRPDRKSAIDAIQKARNGRSASSDPPLTTNAGTAIKSSVAHTGRSEKRQASDHMAHTAIIENTM